MKTKTIHEYCQRPDDVEYYVDQMYAKHGRKVLNVTVGRDVSSTKPYTVFVTVLEDDDEKSETLE